MKSNVLFISDGSLTNPILHSQGLPLLKYLSSKNYNCYLVHFETPHLKKTKKEEIRDIQKSFFDNIIFEEILIKKPRFLPGNLVNGIRTISKIVSLTIKYKFQLIHARSFYPALICLVITYIFPKTKFIYDNRGLFIEEEIFKGRWKESGLFVKFLKKAEKIVVKKADHIIVVSQEFKKYTLKNFIATCSQLEKKITVINNKTNIYREQSNVRINERIKNKNIVGVFAGSAASWQNIFEIKSFAKVCIQYIPNFRLKIVTYHLEDFIKEFQTEPSIFNQVQFIQANSSEVFSHLLTSNFGILLREKNMINSVASPLKFAEYLSAGLPIVLSSGIGDTENVINENKVGVIVESKEYKSTIEELIELLNNPSIYDRCRETAAKVFNISDSFHEYNQIYSKLTS
jgi:glycosyltransferase involved in cell wall biosynthesis